MQSLITFVGKNLGFQAGIINGPVSTTFHLSPERPETPPRPSAVIPFTRDGDFVERGAILDQIQQKCAVPGSRTALVGLGGVGKSQLAIEYAYRTCDQSPETWAFWVYSSNAARFEQSYRDIADSVKIFGRRDPQANIFKLVHNWLRDSKERWLLVLDNVDDARFLLDAHAHSHGLTSDSETAPKPLREYLPHCKRGSILITTRNKEAALKLVEQRDIVAVEPMDEAHALALFEKKLGVQGDSSDVAELAAALEYMPLAIVQAAAYISQRAPRCSVRQYLEKFTKSDRKRISLLSREDSPSRPTANQGQLRRDWEAKKSILITWQISFEHIQQTRPSAADLLSLMSFFDRQGIPEALLRNRTRQGDSQSGQEEWEEDGLDSDEEDILSQSSASGDEFEDDVVTLRNFSFITVNANGITFEMHALVQLGTRKWLEANGKLERWKQQFIHNLYAEFPTGEYENWAACQALFAHAKSAAAQQPEEEESLAEWATLLYRAAWYAYTKGSATDAKKLGVKSMKTQMKILGQEHEDTVRSMVVVGLAYNLEGRWKEAEERFVQVMETRKKKLGVDHPGTLASMGNLALTYCNQGRWKEAEELFVQVMETCKKKLGADHPDTLTSMNNLASTYRYQGQWGAAEELLVQVMEIREKKIGADHPDTLTSMNNLASTYWNQGRWDAAEELFAQVMETSKEKLGVDHPDTLASMNNLAMTYMNQGRWDAAEELQVQVMETFKKLGVDHPDTLTSMANLASTYRNQGRWDAAKELQVQVMETRKEKLGADHPDTLTSMNNLTLTYRNQGRWDAAEELQVQVMETSKEKFGADHPDTVTSMNNLAFTWKEQGRDAEAINLMRECVHLGQHVLGVDDPRFISSLTILAAWEMEQAGDLAGGSVADNGQDVD
ncbi:TPR-like protein [Bimuria novae-zelandiae CBS 107.79]|uniref:TPR-like protein n=1 Tax=Bimuria novae-zelandiae CBS 107.79 TaxID=1447943 RepID=A0A6A5UZC0_9PLEO|nr:TPR-like protein [Bimuria novae-zelandiae CBS 107.79]